MSTKILAVIIALGIASFGLYSVATVNAQELQDYPLLVQRIAEKFGLNPDEVQDVVQQVKAERHEQIQQKMHERMEQRLDDAVNLGRLTQEQADLIRQKSEEMREKYQEIKNLEPQERRERAMELRQEMKNWLEENNIPLPHFGHGFMRGAAMMGGMMRG